MRFALITGTLCLLMTCVTADVDTKEVSSREALKPFNHLVGPWRATGTPYGSRIEKQRGFWTENISWSWKFKGDDAWLVATFQKGKYYKSGELRYLNKKNQYQLTLATKDGKKESYVGSYDADKRTLTVDRSEPNTKETHRMVISLIHDIRYLYRYEVRRANRTRFTRKYQVGATRKGVTFATEGRKGPECVVTGGLGTSKVTYKGQTYYVCCSGCRDAFMENPEKYIAEFKARKAKEAKEKNK